MRVILVCGDRNWIDYNKILEVISKEHKKRPITYLVEGGARGADIKSRWAAEALGIQPVECSALWKYHGKKAGPIRNQKQLDVAMRIARVDEDDEYAESTHNISVIAFHSDLKNSKGTKDMVNRAKKAGVKVKVIT